MFKHLLNFDVIELDPLFSDGHCLLQTTLKCAQVYKPQPNIQNNGCHIPRWKGKFSDSFVSYINLQTFDDILALLRSNNCSRETINTATDMTSKLVQGYTTLNIHEIWLRLFRGEHLLYIRAKMTSFFNSHD